MTLNICTLPAIMTWLLCVQWAGAASPCPELEGKSANAHLEYLRSDRNKLLGKCITVAIKRIGAERLEPGTSTLIQYLDYREPSSDSRMTPGAATPVAFPAVDALNRLGIAAVPKLIDAITKPSATDLIQRNAAETVFLIYGANEEGIRALVNAAHSIDDPIASLRLMDQARRLSHLCVASRNACENAAAK